MPLGRRSSDLPKAFRIRFLPSSRRDYPGYRVTGQGEVDECHDQGGTRPLYGRYHVHSLFRDPLG